ncbi:uncharacterized protein LOC110464916 [Mizuhopecten yessoensis]|nr:uncharacterized protein LOC110464916 [Mizuhopecten yessoensis]
MPSTTSEKDSTCMAEYDDNTTVKYGNIETSSSFKTEVDFECLVSEMAYGKGEDSTIITNDNPDYFPESLYQDANISTDCQTGEVTDVPDSMGYCRCKENIPGNSDIGGKHLENGLRSYRKHSKSNPAINRIVLQSTVTTDYINNNNDRFPKCQQIFEFGRSSTENHKIEGDRNDANLHTFKGNQGRNTDAINTHNDKGNTFDNVVYDYHDVVHDHDDTTDCSDGYGKFRKDKTNCSSENNNYLNGSMDSPHRCINVITDNVLLGSEESKTRCETDFSKSVSSIGSQCFDKDNNKLPTKESRMKSMFINNWTQGLPQTDHINNLLLPEVWDEISDTLLSQTNSDYLLNSTDVFSPVGSDSCTSVSLDVGETACPFSPVSEMPQDLKKISCCSISSLSSLSISDFLLGSSSESSSPYGSQLHSRRTSIDRTADKEFRQSRRSSLSYNENTLSRRSSTTFEGRRDFPRRSSAISRPASPIIKDNSSLQSSRKSSISNRRMSDGSDISSISLSGIFAKPASLFSCSPDHMDDTDRTDTPSPSPFGHQLKYFQDKRKNEMFLVKTTTARLGLNTRRDSYTLWRADNLDTKGRPLLMKPEINIGQNSDVFTKERVAAINLAMDWVREELHQLKEQDESLAHQFLEIRRTIHELKLDWSCKSHREMLIDDEAKIDETKNLKRVSDLPEHHTLDGIFGDKRIIRRSLVNRKYSIF